MRVRAERVRRRARTPRVRGFTLLEVLIALLVLALALLALTRTAALQVQGFADLRERTLAGWLAQDVLAETRLANPLPDPGRNSGLRRFGDRDWRWEVQVQGTLVPSIRRIDVRVAPAAAPRDTVAQLSGFSGLDLAR
ncbi:MAG: type II secretion system minor pseudopilin GspI [Rudaea sp.]